AEDISLKVNGKPRQIKSLSLFRTTSDFALPSSQLPAPYATNAVGMKRSGDSHPDRRAVVNLDGKPVGRVVRTLRKSP
ncbi:MAG TPA: hypothetical protein VEL51_14975, partial [Vicinamibacterales bacterium]|nr:hypothetical protein [Vicinamibacterales bacterium]